MKKIALIFSVLFSVAGFSDYTLGEFEEFLNLEDVIFEKAYIIEGKINKGKLVQATNYSSDTVCVLNIIKESHNVKNEFLNGGKVIIAEGETAVLGGFTQIHSRRSWNAKWRHIKTFNLNRCK